MILEDKLMQERTKAQTKLTEAFVRLADIEVGLEGKYGIWISTKYISNVIPFI